jgi:Zn-dependent protease
MSGGYLSVGRVAGVPVRIHFSALLGPLLVGGWGWRPGAWLAFPIIVIVHELGHALVVRALGARATSITMHALGGECRWAGAVSPVGRSVIAWGGVLGQLLLMLVALGARALAGPPAAGFEADLLARGLLEANLWIALVNLLPIAPLDGAEAWRLFPRLLERRRLRARAAHPRDHALESLARHDARGEIAPEARALVDDLLSSARRERAKPR